MFTRRNTEKNLISNAKRCFSVILCAKEYYFSLCTLWLIFGLFSTTFLNAQDTIYLFGDTIRVGELEWDMEKDWRSKAPLLSENQELYGDRVRIFLGYHSNKLVEQIVFGYLDEEGEFVRHGPARYYYPSGHLLGKRYYEEDILKGPATDFHKNGKPLMHTFFNENVMDGHYSSYYENRKMHQSGTYIKGVVEGRYQSWYSNGQPKWVEHYKAGIKTDIDSSFYETGTLQAVFQFKNGLEDGICTIYHRNGAAWTQRVHEKGRLIKLNYIKSKVGRPLEIGSFDDGWGWLHIYNDDGILIEKDKYKDGYLQKTKVIKK